MWEQWQFRNFNLFWRVVWEHIWKLTVENNCNVTIYFFNFYRTRVRSLFTLVTNSLTPSCLVNLIDVTLACEDVNSMLVEVVKVADVDAKKRVDDSLVQTWKMKFSHKINFLSRLWAQGLVKIEVEVQAQFWSWSLVNILLLILGWDYEDYSW